MSLIHGDIICMHMLPLLQMAIVPQLTKPIRYISRRNS